MADFQSEFKGEGFIGSIIVTIHHRVQDVSLAPPRLK